MLPRGEIMMEGAIRLSAAARRLKTNVKERRR
jgi:hypothetical protein